MKYDEYLISDFIAPPKTVGKTAAAVSERARARTRSINGGKLDLAVH